MLAAWSTLSMTAPTQAQTNATPSLDMARSVFLTRLRSKAPNTQYRLVAFQKLDGQRMQYRGVHMYGYIFQAKVLFPNGFHPECVAKGNRFTGFNCGFMFPARMPGEFYVPPLPANTTWTVEDDLTFEKTERTWLAH